MSAATFTTDLKDKLVAAGVGTFGTDLFIGQMPPGVEGTLLTPYGGRGSDNIHGSAFPRVQVLHRYASYAAAETKAYAVYGLINEQEAYAMGGTFVVRSDALQTPFSLGQDDRQKWRLACNYEFTIRST